MSSSVEQLREQGRLALERKEYTAALECFRAFMADHPQFADVRHAAGICLSFLGRPEEALEQFEAALAINPAYIEALVTRSLVLHELGRYDAASRSFEQAGVEERVQKGRFSAVAGARLANAHSELGDLYMAAAAPAEAVVQYRTALELRPSFHDIRNKLALALLALDAPRDAATELEQILTSNPGFLAARLNLGLAYLRIGRPAAAAEQWRAASELQPDHPQVRAYIALLEHGYRHGVDAKPAND
jgi:tetratricopeptide (TPR) repeat protein